MSNKPKQVIILRKDLNMRKGKIAAQAAHASMAALTNYAIKEENRLVIDLTDPELKAWLEGSFTKVGLYVNSELELRDLHALAKAKGLRVALIQDNGLTEFNGVLTYTALAIGPHSEEKFLGVTDQLPLF